MSLQQNLPSFLVKPSVHRLGKDYGLAIPYSQITLRIYKLWEENTADLNHIHMQEQVSL